MITQGGAGGWRGGACGYTDPCLPYPLGGAPPYPSEGHGTPAPYPIVGCGFSSHVVLPPRRRSALPRLRPPTGGVPRTSGPHSGHDPAPSDSGGDPAASSGSGFCCCSEGSAGEGCGALGDKRGPARAELVERAPPPVSSKSLRFPARPGIGKVGRKCMIRTNHFLENVNYNLEMRHYNIRLYPT